MQDLLQKTRMLNEILQTAGGKPVDFNELAEVLSNVVGANIFVLSRKGKMLGHAITQSMTCEVIQEILANKELPASSNDAMLRVSETETNLSPGTLKNIEPKLDKCLFDVNRTTLVPVVGGGNRLGTLILSRADKPFIDQDVIMAEYGATIVGMEILRARSFVNDELDRNKAIVQMSLDTLSYSELEAVEHIFAELNGREGLLVASKIADRVGITRSVIVNALRKFESAGVIESRSLGMKGTFIRILNDQLIPELNKLRNK